jgi:protein-tyrosine-phosphatase
MTRGPAQEQPFTVLLVCTGNICRSPLAERLGRALLDSDGRSGPWLVLRSAGTRAVVDSAMHPDSALVLQRLGGDPDGFRSTQLAPEIAATADLVLTMTRDHRREVLTVAPRLLKRTFTLREAADLMDRVADGIPATPGDEATRARALVAAMADARALRASGPDDDVPDPIGLSSSVHRRAGDLIADALRRILGRLAPLPAAEATIA